MHPDQLEPRRVEQYDRRAAQAIDALGADDAVAFGRLVRELSDICELPVHQTAAYVARGLKAYRETDALHAGGGTPVEPLRQFGVVLNRINDLLATAEKHVGRDDAAAQSLATLAIGEALVGYLPTIAASVERLAYPMMELADDDAAPPAAEPARWRCGKCDGGDLPRHSPRCHLRGTETCTSCGQSLDTRGCVVGPSGPTHTWASGVGQGPAG